MDIRLRARTGVMHDKYNENTAEGTASMPVADGGDVVTGKVLKYLLTSRGSDAFDPSYGSTCIVRNQIAESELMLFRLQVLEDLSDCAKFIRRTESADSEHRLSRIDLTELAYDPSAGVVHIHIRIVLTDGTVTYVQV